MRKGEGAQGRERGGKGRGGGEREGESERDLNPTPYQSMVSADRD